MQLPGRVALLLCCCCWTTLGQGSSAGDPWAQCKNKSCERKFANEVCDEDCIESECLSDGFDCIKDKSQCNSGHVDYCKHHYDNSHCDQGCNNVLCGWDGSDCHHDPIWAKGSLIVQTRIPFTQGPFQNNSLLWTLSTLLRTTVKLRDRAPFQPSSDLHRLRPQQLADLLKPTAPVSSSEGSLLFLQVDNKPCIQQQETSCFPSAPGAARFLQARMASSGRIPSDRLAEVQVIVHVRGVMEEIGNRSDERVETKTGGKRGENRDAAPAWLWPVVGAGVGLGLTVVVAVVLVVVWVRRRRERAGETDRVRHRSTGTDNGKNNNGSKAWIETASHRGERGKDRKEKEKNGLKKKKGKDTGKKRREPLGEDAIRLRPLRKDLDIGSDTDMTQSSMEDVRYARREEICDHRTPEQKNFRLLPNRPPSLSPMQAPPRGWERNSTPSLQRSQTPTNTAAPVQWCGPDGSVVLIRAVRSGLDRVVLELLRAGVPVNNTDHTGRSALHWACTVNHLSLARTLIRYGAAVDLQDNKGETALFLSALHGCYDTARFLLLNGANQELCDRHGRRPLHVAREGMHHQVLELLLAHRVQRGPPVPVDPGCEVLWDDRAFLYSPWAAAPSLPSRSNSFSGAVTPRGLASPPPPSDWSMGPRQCPSPQNWRPSPSQSTTALVTPRILGLPPRPISTLQEVTSEAEEEEREAARDREGPRAITPHFLSPQPAPRQRSFSCTQHALQRRSGCNPAELSLHVPSPTEKAANEHMERVISPPPREAPNQLENKGSVPVPPKPQMDHERETGTKNCNQKSEKANHENLTSVQSAL